MQMNKTVEQIVADLKQGKIIATPTDTVWGFLVDGSNEQAVENLYTIKDRDITKQLIVFVDSEEHIKKYAANIPSYAEKFMHAFWPGKLTLVLSTNEKVYEKQQTKTIGVRQPNAEHLRQIVTLFEHPILSTSANVAGNPVLQNASEIRNTFGEAVEIWEPITISAETILGRTSSTVVECIENNSWEILREGAVAKEALWDALDKDRFSTQIKK